MKRSNRNPFKSGILFQNPYSEVSFGNILLQLDNAFDGTIDATFTTTLPTQPFIRGSITTASVDATTIPRVVGQTNTEITLSFTPTATLAAGKVQLQFPAWYRVSTVDSTLKILTLSATSNCQRVSTNLNVDTCTLVGQALTFDYSAFTGVGSISLRLVNNFRNPVNRNIKTDFKIIHQDSLGNAVAESAILQLTNRMDTATAITTASGSFGANVVSTSTSLTISINYPIPTELNCFVEIVIPSDIPVNQATITGYQGTGFFNNDGTSAPNTLANSYVTWPSSQTVRIEACRSAANIATSTEAGPVGTFTISNLQVPNQVRATNAFTINTYQSNSYDAANLIATGSFIIPASAISPGTITLTSWTPLTAQDFRVQYSNGQYSATFTPSHSLYSSSKIVISPPSQISSTSCTYLSGNPIITSTPTCTRTVNGWELTNLWTDDGNALTNDYIGGNQIVVSLGTGINPISVQQAGSWTVHTQNLVSGIFYQVDTGTLATSFITTAGTISPVSVSATPTITSAQNGVYTFTFNTDNNIPASGIVQIIFPSSVQLLSTATCTFQDNVVPQTAGSCTQVANGIRITVTTQHLAANNPMVLRFGNFQNPRTFQPSGSFTVTSMDSLGNMIDTGSGFSLTMTTLNTFTSFSVTRASEQNGITNSYTISFTSSTIRILNGDILTITFPSEITLTGNGCTGVNQITSITCSRSGQTLTAQLNTVSSNTGTFSFSVASARNPRSFRPASTFSNIFLEDINGNDALQYDTVINPIILADTVQGVIGTSSLNPTSYSSNTASTFGISFVTTNAIGNDGSILLHYPSQITVASSAACLITIGTFAPQNNRCTINTASNTVSITNAFNSVTTPFSGSIAISLVGTTPANAASGMNPFYFTTYDDTAQLFDIDVLTQAASTLIPQLECNYPCATCLSSTQKSMCTSCFSAPNPEFLQTNLLAGTATCQMACDTGYTSNGNTNPKLCVQCISSCETCQDTGTNGDVAVCLTCAPATNFKLGTSCFNACPAGYYNAFQLNNDNICQACTLPCTQCSLTATTCTACDASSTTPILFNSGCISACPPNYVNIGNVCQQCTSPCFDCSGSQTSCTSCIGGYYRYGNQCYNPCPLGTTPDTTNMRCLGCQTGCDVCDNADQSKCLTCSTGYYFFQNQCWGSCPKDYQVTSPNICTQILVTPTKPEVVKFNNTIYIQGETKYVYVNVTTDNGTLQRVVITNTTIIKLDLPLIYFPHLIAAAVMTLISLGGYCKDRNHAIISSIIALCGPIELLSYGVQGAFSYFQTSDLKLVLLAAVAFGSKILINILFWLFYLAVIKSDPGYEYWRSDHRHGSRCIACSGCTFSFKLYRFLYNHFYGFDSYKAYFEQPRALQITIIVFSCLNMIFSYAPILFADISCLIKFDQFQWGTQLYICLLETAALTTYILILTIIEFFRLNKLIVIEEPYVKVRDESMESQKDNFYNFAPDPDHGNNELERKLREEMLKKIMSQVKGNTDLFLNNKLDELINQFGDRRCQSMGQLEDNEHIDDPREVRSFPMSPKSQVEANMLIGEPFKALPLEDNVYAEAAPKKELPAPIIIKEEKEVNDMSIQVFQGENQNQRKSALDPPNFKGIEVEEIKKNFDKGKKKRGRKGQYYQKIDEEDELAEELDDNIYDDLGVIEEVNEDEFQIRDSPPQKGSSSRRSSQYQDPFKNRKPEVPKINQLEEIKKKKDDQNKKKYDDSNKENKDKLNKEKEDLEKKKQDDLRDLEQLKQKMRDEENKKKEEQKFKALEAEKKMLEDELKKLKEDILKNQAQVQPKVIEEIKENPVSNFGKKDEPVEKIEKPNENKIIDIPVKEKVPKKQGKQQIYPLIKSDEPIQKDQQVQQEQPFEKKQQDLPIKQKQDEPIEKKLQEAPAKQKPVHDELDLIPQQQPEIGKIQQQPIIAKEDIFAPAQVPIPINQKPSDKKEINPKEELKQKVDQAQDTKDKTQSKELEKQISNKDLKPKEEEQKKLEQQQLEDQKKKKLEDEQKAKELEKKKQENDKKAQEDKLKQEKLQRDLEAKQKLEEEKKRKEDEKKQREEEERQRKEQEKQRKEEERKKQEEDKKLKLEQEKQRKEEEKKQKEDLKKQKEEQERLEKQRKLEEKQKKEEEERQRKEEEKKRKEEERLKKLEEKKQKEEEEKKKKEELRQKQEQLKKEKAEEEQRKKEEEKQKKEELQKQKLEQEKKIQQDKLQKEIEEKKREEAEKQKQQNREPQQQLPQQPEPALGKQQDKVKEPEVDKKEEFKNDQKPNEQKEAEQNKNEQSQRSLKESQTKLPIINKQPSQDQLKEQRKESQKVLDQTEPRQEQQQPIQIEKQESHLDTIQEIPKEEDDPIQKSSNIPSTKNPKQQDSAKPDQVEGLTVESVKPSQQELIQPAQIIDDQLPVEEDKDDDITSQQLEQHIENLLNQVPVDQDMVRRKREEQEKLRKDEEERQKKDKEWLTQAEKDKKAKDDKKNKEDKEKQKRDEQFQKEHDKKEKEKQKLAEEQEKKENELRRKEEEKKAQAEYAKMSEEEKERYKREEQKKRDEEKQKQEEEKRIQEQKEQKRKEEERLKKDEEERIKAEEERKRKEEEKQKKEEEKRKREEEEKKEKEEQQRRQEEEKLKKEEEKKRKQMEKEQRQLEEKVRKEQERKQQEEERKAKEEEARIKKEEERKKKEEEKEKKLLAEKLKKEEERKKKEEEKQRKEEEELRKKEEQRKKKEEQEQKKREEQERKIQEELQKKKAEEQRIEEEKMKKREEEQKKKDQERLAKEEKEKALLEQKLKQEEEKRKKQEELERKKEEERLKQEEDLKKAKEQQEREKERKLKEAEDKKLKQIEEAKLAQEKKEKEEQEEKEKREKVEKDRKEKEEKLKKEKEEKIQKALEKREKEKQERLEKERLDTEAALKLKQEQEKLKKEQEQKLKEEQDRQEKERLAQIEKEKQQKQQEEAKKMTEEERQKQQELEQMMQKLEEERLQQEQEETEKRLKEEEEANRLEEQIQKEQELSKYSPSEKSISKADRESMQRERFDEIDPGEPEYKPIILDKGEPKVQFPPVAEKRNFNQHDILGDFDKDEKGNNIILQDPFGNNIDKQGNKVNQQGYVVDSNGDIIDKNSKKKMFRKHELDQKGELPAPFSLEKNNFNPNNIIGDVDKDPNGNIIAAQDQNGQLVDKKGRKINPKGYLVDDDGNIVDKHGQKKIDNYLVNEAGEVPKLYNYNGRRFLPKDIAGEFDQDPEGNAIIRQKRGGQLLDKQNRPVNEKGYLVDEQGNIIDKNGKKIFDQKHLKNGEVPKILPTSKFNIKGVQGDLEMDPLGNPMFEKNRNGEPVDKDGKRVNKKGYLVDKEGNILNKQGQKMFDKDILDKDGEIPKVFRTGLLRSDSASSFSRLMSEIDKDQSDFHEDKKVQKAVDKLYQQIKKSPASRGSNNSSVDSLMADTPSNYNIANQRYEEFKMELDKVEPIDEEESDSEGMLDQLDEVFNNTGMQQIKKKKKKKQFKEVTVLVQPSKKEQDLAKAYGGSIKPQVITKVVPVNRSRSKLPKLNNRSLSQLQNSVTGLAADKGGVNTSRLRKQFDDLSSEDEKNQNFYPLRNVEHSSALDSIRNQYAAEEEKYRRKKPKKDDVLSSDQDYGKTFEDNINQYLENSDSDNESMEKLSHFFKGPMGATTNNNSRVKQMEKNYLQRIEPHLEQQPYTSRVDMQKKKRRFGSNLSFHNNDNLEVTQRKENRNSRADLIDKTKKFL